MSHQLAHSTPTLLGMHLTLQSLISAVLCSTSVHTLKQGIKLTSVIRLILCVALMMKIPFCGYEKGCPHILHGSVYGVQDAASTVRTSHRLRRLREVTQEAGLENVLRSRVSLWFARNAQTNLEHSI